MKKILIILLVAAVIAGAVHIYLERERQERLAEERAVLENDPQELEQKILSFQLANYAKDGRKKWLLRGDSADILAEIVNLQHIDMETFDDTKIMLTALRGAYDKVNKEISLYDDVEVLTSDGATLTTDYLKWNSETDTVTTDKRVRIVRSDMTADGEGAVAMPQMKRVILNKDVKVWLSSETMKEIEANVGAEGGNAAADGTPPKVTITCKGPLEIDYEANIAVFNDDVVVDDARGQIYSEVMEAFLDPESKSIVRVVAEGEVRVVRGEDSTYSEKAIYTTVDQKITLLGKPKIYIHSAEDMDKIEKELENL